VKKIDNGLCFPYNNKYLINYLAYLPNAKLPLSLSMREKIERIDYDAIAEILNAFGLEEAIPAASTRLFVLKNLATRTNMTIEELNLRMELLSLPLGERLALLECSKQELEKMASQKEIFAPSLHTKNLTPHANAGVVSKDN
jgi:hypothetical protein